MRIWKVEMNESGVGQQLKHSYLRLGILHNPWTYEQSLVITHSPFHRSDACYQYLSGTSGLLSGPRQGRAWPTRTGSRSPQQPLGITIQCGLSGPGPSTFLSPDAAPPPGVVVSTRCLGGWRTLEELVHCWISHRPHVLRTYLTFNKRGRCNSKLCRVDVSYHLSKLCYELNGFLTYWSIYTRIDSSQ